MNDITQPLSASEGGIPQDQDVTKFTYDKRNWKKLIVIGVVVLALVGGGYVGYQKQTKSSAIPCTDTSQCPPANACVNGVCEPATPFPKESSSSADMSNWKTYFNQEWQVTFSYPAQWEMKPFGNDVGNPTYIELEIKEAPYVGFSYVENSRNLTLEQIDEENRKKDVERGAGMATPLVAPENYTTITTQNGYTTYYEKEYFCEPSICERYTIIGSNKIIQIIVFPRIKEIENYSEIIDQILSTFKFTQ